MMKLQEQFPWERVNQDRNRKWLQRKHSVEDAKREYLHSAIPCPNCNTQADQLAWFYFLVSIHFSPKRAGWLTVCDRCHLQVDFFLEQQELFAWEQVDIYKNDNHFQNQHSLEDAKNEYLHNAVSCPRCKKEANQLSWVYIHSGELYPQRAGWLTICDQCSIQIDFFVEEQVHYYPWEEVNKSRNDKELQIQHSLQKAKSRYLESATSCPKCKTLPDQLSWFYFVSSKESWKSLAGRAGWMVVCDKCNIQVDFLVEILS